LRPKKRFGQNFLYDPAIARKIVEAAELSPDQCVIELGAGKGILTTPLANTGARLIALELDRNLQAALESEMTADPANTGEFGPRAEVLNVDFTKSSLTGLLAARGLDRCVLMGNIPYHHTRDVLFSFLVDEHEMIEAGYLMLQREVGQRILSPPGSRVYGITSVILQSLYAVRLVMRVAPGSFFPRPRVASVVLEFKPLDEPLVGADELRRFSKVVKNLFQQRRKTIHNTIRSFYAISDAGLEEIHAASEIDLNKRPEELSKEDFLRLTRALADVTSAG
jgi:16S rRNA (adenine1518-N6/adenine1519-N6)-dimethyltransferase